MDGVTKIFYDHVAEGELWLQHDPNGGRWIFPPRELAEGGAEWRNVSGRGSIYSWTVIDRVMHAAFASPPYVIALVRLEEGPILMTRLLDTKREDVDFDIPVYFDPDASRSAQVPFPLFRLVRS
jgi:uncharacterized OB-fold protein